MTKKRRTLGIDADRQQALQNISDRYERSVGTPRHRSFPPAEPAMIEHRVRRLSSRAGLTRALVATLLVVAGLVGPVTGTVPAHAAPSGPVTAGAGDDAVVSQLR